MSPRDDATRYEVIPLRECRALFQPSRDGMRGRSEGIVGEMNGDGRRSLHNDALRIAERARKQRRERANKRKPLVPPRPRPTLEA